MALSANITDEPLLLLFDILGLLYSGLLCHVYQYYDTELPTKPYLGLAYFIPVVVGCRQRRNLARTLRDNDDVISTLEMLMGIVMHLLAVVAYAAIFGTDVGHLLISLSSISVASAFVFGNSLKTIYESVVFLFVIRPYQVWAVRISCHTATTPRGCNRYLDTPYPT